MLQIWCFWAKAKALKGGHRVGAIAMISDDEHDETKIYDSPLANGMCK
jgi:hypothetical protein